VDQETKKAQEKPVLSAESFQRLLAAAYLLQVDKDRPVLQPIEAGHTNLFRAGAIVQKRTPSLLAGQPRVLASRSSAPFHSSSDSDKGAEICPPHVSTAPRLATEVTGVSLGKPMSEGQRAAQFRSYSGWLMPLVEPTVLHATKIFAGRVMFFRGVEALAIAAIFFAVIGVSIHRSLSANPGSTSMLAEMPGQQSSPLPAMPVSKLLASGQEATVTLSFRQLPHAAEADTVAEDAVVHYLKQALDLPGQSANKPAMLASEKVVQYGPDVTVWSGNLTQRDGLDHLGR
jgi:hypothetical protein